MKPAGRVALRTFATVVLPGAIAGTLLTGALALARVHVPVGYLIGLGVVTFALAKLARITLAELEPPPAAKHGPRTLTSDRPGLLAPLERRLANATRQRRLYVVGLRPLLWDLARERVRLHRGVDLARLPAEAARELVGNQAWQWLTTQDEDGPAPTPDQITDLVRKVGNL